MGAQDRCRNPFSLWTPGSRSERLEAVASVDPQPPGAFRGFVRSLEGSNVVSHTGHVANRCAGLRFYRRASLEGTAPEFCRNMPSPEHTRSPDARQVGRVGQVNTLPFAFPAIRRAEPESD